jgi:WD40 repeat protein
MRILPLAVSLLALAVSGCNDVLPHRSPTGLTPAGADGARTMRDSVPVTAPAKPPTMSVSDAFFSHDGKILLLRFSYQRGYGRGNEKPPDFLPVRLWDVESGKELPPLSEALTAELARSSLHFLPDGKSVLVGTGEGPLRVWELASGKILRTFDDDSKGFFPCDISPDGKFALLQDPRRGLQLWDLATGNYLRTFLPGKGYSGRFSPDGKRVFVPLVGADRQTAEVAVLDTASGELRLSLAGMERWMYPLAFAPDDHVAVSEYWLPLQPGDKSTLALWDWTTGQEQRVFEKREGGREGREGNAAVAAFTLDGKALVTLDYDQMLRRWSVATGKVTIQVSLEAEHPSVYAVTHDGRVAVTTGGAQDGLWKGVRFTLWDTATGMRIRTVIPGETKPQRARIKFETVVLAAANGSLARHFPDRRGFSFFTIISFIQV